MNSLYEDELEAILNHANRQRYSVDEGDMLGESISMDKQMHDLMMKHPWKSVSTLISGRLTHVL